MYLKKEVSGRVLLSQHFTLTQAPSLKSHESISFLRDGPMFLGYPSFPCSYHGAWPAADGAAQLITFFCEPTVSCRCEDNRLAHWKGCFIWTETLFPGSSLSPSTVGLPHILGKVHPLDNSQGKINLLTLPKSSFQFLHKMVQKHQWNFWPTQYIPGQLINKYDN